MNNEADGNVTSRYSNHEPTHWTKFIILFTITQYIFTFLEVKLKVSTTERVLMMPNGTEKLCTCTTTVRSVGLSGQHIFLVQKPAH